MSSPNVPGPEPQPSPWFATNRAVTRTVPATPAEAPTPIYTRMVTEFGDPFSALGPTRARWAPRTGERPAAT
ncbi:hypothetical protein HUT16_27385 [Kitasatospora sp. NA04385]|uniref:hypothetical protein n=1 Tax=Kitasatospora sp. NA04385 TaxID=2742135 RepID=UPI0015917C22|nr:hypothetical protein [Kitasatospora sp. NA04385]QKW22304.1 hypothetical protein HUT16_27385 [Kitasatospora sp. NA04385]